MEALGAETGRIPDEFMAQVCVCVCVCVPVWEHVLGVNPRALCYDWLAHKAPCNMPSSW